MSEREPTDEGAFKVVDRRRFTADGRTRADQPADDPAPQPRATTPERGATSKRARPAPGDQERTADFLGFVASLATNAMAALGLLPEAEARGLPKDPRLAREYIDIIAMLKEKTRGNLAPNEDQALQRLLTDLRLQYVETTRRPPGP